MEILNAIFDLVKEHGALTSILSITAFIALIFYRNKLSERWKSLRKVSVKVKVNDEEEKVNATDLDIINHEIFVTIEHWLESKIPTIILKTEFRTLVFTKYLDLYFRAYKEVIFEFVKDGSYKEMKGPELKQFLLQIFTDVVNEYENNMRKIKLPDVIIAKMKAKNNETLNLSRDLVSHITDNSFYNSEDNSLKVYSFLNIVLSILENTLAHCEELSNTLNGELKGIKFEGVSE
jgi:hypothetical protein